jgi:hypothetical protein
VGLLIEAQRRFNIARLDAILREALAPANRRNVYAVHLRDMSAAEWMGMLAPLGFQWRSRTVIRLDTLHYDRPIPFPPNLRIIATMDADRLPMPSPQSLAGISLIHWDHRQGQSQVSGAPRSHLLPPQPSFEGPLKEGGIGSAGKVSGRIRTAGRSHAGALRTLFSVLRALDGIPETHLKALQENAIMDLSNSLAWPGAGLFHSHPEANSLTALDLHLSLSLLPTVLTLAPEAASQLPLLAESLRANCPRAHRYLQNYIAS